jgi:hypothetical protein
MAGHGGFIHWLLCLYYDTNVKTAWVIVATSVAVILTTG